VIRGLPVLFFLSGALGLVYEVLWVRRLTTVFGPPPWPSRPPCPASSSASRWAASRSALRSRRWRRPLVAFGLLEIGVGLGALLFQPILGLYATSTR
jgi:spermidine synthase